MRVVRNIGLSFITLLLFVVVSPAWADSVSGTVGNNTGFYGDTTLVPAVGVTVYADVNNNKAKDSGEPSVVTDAGGAYTLASLPAGSYRVRFLPSAGYSCVQMEGHCSSVTVTAVDGGDTTTADQNLHQFKASATAQGSTFADTNRNGTKDRGEASLAGITVFQDINGNMVVDPGEPTTLSSGANGSWTLKVAPGHAQVLTVGGTSSYSMGAPRSLSGLDTTIGISSGNFGSCAVLANNTVKCWGDNSSGALGNGVTPNAEMPFTITPQTVSGISNATQVSAGEQFACALTSNGAVWCWGDNSYGQLGNGTTTGSNVPVQVTGVSDAVQVAAGQYGACAVTQSGDVWCWGDNQNGVYSGGSSKDTEPHATAQKAAEGISKISLSGDAACAVTAAATVSCWGSSNIAGESGNSSISGISDAVNVAVAGDSACALESGGAVKCWGLNTYGQLGNGTTNSSSTPSAVPGVSGANKLFGGIYGALCAGFSNGGVKCWGNNSAAQFGIIPLTPDNSFGPNSFSLGSQNTPVLVDGFKNSSLLSVVPGQLCGKASGALKCSGLLYGFWWDALSGQPFTDGSTTTIGPIGVGKTLASPAVSSKPAKLTNSTSAAFTASFKPGALGFCRLDDDLSWHGTSADGVDCSNYSVDNLSDGPHTFSIVQFDLSAGITISNSVSYSWTVNTSTPAPPTVNAKPAATTNSNSAGISFSGDKDNTFTCKIDDAAWSACSSPLYLSGLADGSHSVQIKQVNSLGTQSAAASVTWTQATPYAAIKTITSYSAGTNVDSLSCANSVVTTKDQSKLYVWFKGGVVIGTSSKIALTDTMWGNDITCVAFVVNGSTVTAYPAAAWNQALPLPKALSGPLTRRPSKSSTVSCVAGKWKYGPITLSYQWLRNGVNISGATGVNYTLTNDDTGKTIACKVTATNPTGSTSNTQSIAQRSP